MNQVCMLAAALLLSVATYGQSAPAPSPQDPAALATAFFKALLDEDSKTMGSLVASDFTITNADGQTFDRTLLVQAMGSGLLIINTGATSAIQVRQYNDNAAVVTGSWKAKGSLQGEVYDTDAVFSVIGIKQNGSWKAVYTQLSATK